MIERRSDRVVPIVLSVLVHAAIVGALLWGWWRYRAPKPAPQTLAIEATVVRNAPQPAATPPPPPEAPPPDLQAQQKARDEEAAREQAQTQQREAEQKLAAQEKAQREEAARAEQERAEAERQAKEEADRKAQAEAERKAQELAQQRKTEQEREADLRSQLQVEEHLDAARSSGELAQYQALIAARMQRAWIRPPSAHAGISCTVLITQVPGGEVTGVQIQSCNGDDAVRQSIEDAAYRASPLPAPPDPALFDRNVLVNFNPHD